MLSIYYCFVTVEHSLERYNVSTGECTQAHTNTTHHRILKIIIKYCNSLSLHFKTSELFFIFKKDIKFIQEGGAVVAHEQRPSQICFVCLFVLGVLTEKKW